MARIKAFSYSGFRVKLAGNVVRYYQSFVGRDFKAWAQMAPFIIGPYLHEGQKEVWLALSKVHVAATNKVFFPLYIYLVLLT